MLGRSRWFVGSSMTIRCGPLSTPRASRILRISPGLGVVDARSRPGREPRRLMSVMTRPSGPRSRRLTSACIARDSSSPISCGTTSNLSGGTFVANAHDQAAIANFDRIVYSGEFTFDSNGMTNLTMSGNADLSAHPGSVFIKTGIGTLTVGALPPTDTVRVSGGTLALAATEDGTSDEPKSAGIDLATSTSGDQSLVGILDLGGRTLVRSSLALNGGELQNGTLTIDGFLDIPLDGSIVNRGVLDLSDATIRLAEPENVRSAVVVKCADGGVITGVPKRGNLPKGWRVRIVNGNLALTSGGTHIILR